jgi:hypothetical protein
MNIEDIKIGQWYKVNYGYFKPTEITKSKFNQNQIFGTRIKCILNNGEMYISLSEHSESFSMSEFNEPCDVPSDFIKFAVDTFCKKNNINLYEY